MCHQSTSLSTQGVWVCIALALVLQLAIASPAQRPIVPHHLNKRSFYDIQCKGVYDKSIFARVDRICEDCYNLYREPQLHSLCRSDCFSTRYSQGCVEALQLYEEWPLLVKMIEYLKGSRIDWVNGPLIKLPKGSSY